ncbi:hypothetical protein [Baaleninema sp.]|uniref:hypothetical protein n=1 Tax=Baaleninema sp. TaxID=3101197 RepID=UPI003CFEE6FB
MLQTLKYPSKKWIAWWAKFTAVLAAFNLFLGLFDLSYIAMRDVYLRYVPELVTLYDPVKGIEPHPQTEKYLESVDRLIDRVGESGLDSQQTEALLAGLRSQSDALIDENPFTGSGKFATFAKLQRRISDRLGTDSAKQALRRFWTTDYLETYGVRSELAFFQTRIAPLLDGNYYRPTDDYGQPVDWYWRIDAWFIVFFAIEYLALTFFVSRRRAGVTWGEAMLRRWYDLFLLVPIWRWLRIIPVAVRLHQSKVANMEGILSQITYEPAAYLSDRVSEFVTVRTLNQAQEAITEGDMARAILQPSSYINVGDANTLETITDRLLQLTIYRVLPEVQPELRSLLHYSLDSAFRESAFVELLERIPALKHLPQDTIDNLSNYLANATCDALANAYADEIGRERFEELTQEFQVALRRELQDEKTLDELQTLLSDLLEEVKINYVERSAERTPEETIEDVEAVFDRIERENAASKPQDSARR